MGPHSAHAKYVPLLHCLVTNGLQLCHNLIDNIVDNVADGILLNGDFGQRLDGVLHLLERGRELDRLGGRARLDGVTALVDDVGVVGGSATVPGEKLKASQRSRSELMPVETYVGGVLRDVGQRIRGGDVEQVLLELLGCDVGNSIGRVLAGLEGKKISQETSNVRRGHGGARDGVCGVLAADPGRLNVEAGSKDVVALAIVGEESTLVSQVAGADSDGLLGSSWGVAARIGVVISGGDSKVDASFNSSVNGLVKDGGLSTTERHVGSAALETLLALLGLGLMSLSGKFDTLDDIGHGAGAVGAEDLDSNDVCLLGDTILLASDGARAVGAVSISILVLVAVGDGGAPGGTALEINVLNVGAGIDDIDVDTFTTISVVEVLVEGAEGEAVTVRDTGEAPWGVLLKGWLFLGRHHCVNLRISLDELDLWKESALNVLQPRWFMP